MDMVTDTDMDFTLIDTHITIIDLIPRMTIGIPNLMRAITQDLKLLVLDRVLLYQTSQRQLFDLLYLIIIVIVIIEAHQVNMTIHQSHHLR